MFECGSRNRKVDCFLGGFSGKEGIDKSAAEGISAAYTVNDSEVIGAAEALVFAVIKHTCPVVIACRNGGTEGDCNFFESEFIGKLFCN